VRDGISDRAPHGCQLFPSSFPALRADHVPLSCSVQGLYAAKNNAWLSILMLYILLLGAGNQKKLCGTYLSTFRGTCPACWGARPFPHRPAPSRRMPRSSRRLEAERAAQKVTTSMRTPTAVSSGLCARCRRTWPYGERYRVVTVWLAAGGSRVWADRVGDTPGSGQGNRVPPVTRSRCEASRNPSDRDRSRKSSQPSGVPAPYGHRHAPCHTCAERHLLPQAFPHRGLVLPCCGGDLGRVPPRSAHGRQCPQYGPGLGACQSHI
jgi:hypothetical protein